jgi:hypothetical protein
VPFINKVQIVVIVVAAVGVVAFLVKIFPRIG